MALGKAEEIAAKLRAEIGDGALAPGTKLAAERELAKAFGVNRMTVRNALHVLAGEGLIARYPVRGTFVRERKEIMEQDSIKAMQESAEGHYEDAPMGSMQKVGWMQNRLLAEIALQLAKQSEHVEALACNVNNLADILEQQNSLLAKQNEVLEQIVKQMKVGIVVEQA